MAIAMPSSNGPPSHLGPLQAPDHVSGPGKSTVGRGCGGGKGSTGVLGELQFPGLSGQGQSAQGSALTF